MGYSVQIMMKKILAAISVLVMTVSLSACQTVDNRTQQYSRADAPASIKEESSIAEISRADIAIASDAMTQESSTPAETAKPESTSPSAVSDNPESELSTEADTEAERQPSEDLFDFEVSVDGKLISVPCMAVDLEALDYSFGNKSGNILENGYTTSGLMKRSDGNYLSVGIVNTSGSEKTFAECEIDDIYFFKKSSNGQSFVFAKGITFGCSENDIAAAFGEPSEKSESGDLITLSYYKAKNDRNNRVVFNIWKGELNEVDICSER